VAEDTVLQSCKRMLHGGSPQPHHLRRGAVLHALQCAFMQMSRDETLRTVGAACFQNTGAASFRLRGIVHGSIFARECLRLRICWAGQRNVSVFSSYWN